MTFICLCRLFVHFCPCSRLPGVSERLSRSVYYGFEAISGDFVVIYEWSLRWNQNMGKFLTSQEKGKIENCKKQASNEKKWIKNHNVAE